MITILDRAIARLTPDPLEALRGTQPSVAQRLATAQQEIFDDVEGIRDALGGIEDAPDHLTRRIENLCRDLEKQCHEVFQVTEIVRDVIA